MADDGAQCPRCLEFQDEVRQLQQRLAASGQYVTYSQGPNPGFEIEHELQRWLAVNPRSTAAAGFRAGWARMAKLVGPRLREWEARWWRSVRDNDRIRARLGNALPVSWNTPLWRARRALRVGPLASSRSLTNSGGEATG